MMAPGLRFLSIAPGRFNSVAGAVRRLGRLFKTEKFDVVFVVAGMPIPNLEYVWSLLPDATALVPLVVGDRDHAYEPTMRTSAYWNVAVAISPRLQQETERRMPGKPVRLLATGVDLASDHELSGRLPFSKPLKLLYVGRLFGRKNVHLLPAIMAECQGRELPVTLTIVGHGDDRDSLAQSCQEYGVSHQIRFEAAPTQADLYRIFREHHVLLLTSEIGEGLGLVLLEAQANGCVPVASRIPGVTDFAIQAGETGLLAEIGNAGSFADQIGRLLDQTCWDTMSWVAIARMPGNFSLAEMSKAYGGLLKELQQGQYALAPARSECRQPRLRIRDSLPGPIYRIVNRLNRFQ